MEWMVMTMDPKPLQGPIWTPTKNDVFQYQGLLHLVHEPWKLTIFNFKRQLRI
jgi:hypothetical protein